MHTLPRAGWSPCKLPVYGPGSASYATASRCWQGSPTTSGHAGSRRLDDVVPLLFPHTVYKSYPASLVLNARVRTG